jgi:SAM-dependent methyltransferase
MKDGRHLDEHKGSYTPDFPYFEENRMVHAAYGANIARHILATGTRSALSLGIGHTEVARAILATLSNGPLQHYLVVDAAPEIIDDFARLLFPLPPGLQLLQGFFETFEWPERFDVIEAGFILEHVDDPALVLKRLHQFLAPGGRVFIAVPNARSLHRVLGHSAGLLADMYALSPADLALGHQRYFDLETLCALVSAAGFQVVLTQGMLLKPFTTGQLNQLNLPPTVWRALLEISAGYPEISNSIYLEAVA